LHGTERPDTFLGVNYGSFDVASQLLPLPNMVISRPHYSLNRCQVNYIKALNGNDPKNGLGSFDEAGTRKVLAKIRTAGYGFLFRFAQAGILLQSWKQEKNSVEY